jgi:hypothetical protein
MKLSPYAVAFLLCLSITARAQSFYDNFTRSSDPGPLGAWTTNSGTWTVTGGTFQSGLNPLSSYANAYITNTFTNYTVQARLKFPAGAYGGGLGGRLNTASGAHYAAWVYPENSAGGSNMLKLIKFQSFTSFSYLNASSTPIATANLAAVGTGFHTVRMDCLTNRITVFFDGVPMITTNDVETTYYTNGAVSLDMWTDVSPYLLTADDVAANSTLTLSANSDTNTAVSGLTLTVTAPGVLANDTGGAGPLSASVVANPAHGILNLSSNGGFTYTATNGFTGTDTFNYRANDGVTSSTNTVTIIVTPDNPPVANNDFYSTTINSTLNVPGPGVLTNDTDVDGNSLTAVLALTTINGTLTLTNNGGFTYVPTNGFVGADTFSYRASDGISNSAPATVTISVQPPGLFLDNFSRGTDPGPLTPWATNAASSFVTSGNWSVTGGQLRAGSNVPSNYAYIYLPANSTNNWTNFVAQARLQFQAGGYGGGLGARFNPATGSHYAAWVYPEGSAGGGLQLRLIKFSNYTTFTEITHVPLTAVGTNFHTVALAFFTNQIAVYFDGARMITATDSDYASGSLSLEMWTDASAYVMSVDDVSVNNLVRDDYYAVNQDTLLSVPAAGVLANDTEVYGTSLTAALVTGPSHGTLTLTNNGGFTYLPSTSYVGPDSFVYTTTDGSTNLGNATVNITVNAVNHPPQLTAITDQTINALTLLSVTNTATDPDSPPQTLAYSLSVSPALSGNNPAISTNGIITWTPSQAQGSNRYTFTTVVMDNGAPPLSATNSFRVTVKTNFPPAFVLTPSNRVVLPLTALSITNVATDPDPDTLTYTLLNPPTGASISNGIISWTPGQDQDLANYVITTIVTDNGIPPLSATNSFTITVSDQPIVGVSSTSILVESCTPTNNAVDPGETVTMLFSLKNTGLVNTTNLLVSLLETNGVSAPSAAQTYGVLVAGGAAVSQPFSFTANAGCGATINPTFQLQDNALSLGSILGTNSLGVSGILFTQNFDSVTIPALPIGWTATNSTPLGWITTNTLADTAPNAAFGPDSGTAGTADLVSPVIPLPFGQSRLSFRHRYSFECDTVTAPVPTNGYDGGVLEIKMGTNGFTDILAAGGAFLSNGYNSKISFKYSNPLTNRSAWSGNFNSAYSNVVVNLPFVASPFGTNIQLRWRIGTDTNNGAAGWRVDSIGVVGALCCSHVPPVLAAQPNQTINELAPFTLDNSATDTSTAPGPLNYSLTVSPPATNATISTNGLISWTPTEAQGPGVYVFTTIVSDSATPQLSATNSFQVTVNEVNSPPVLPHPQPDRTIIGLATLTVTNTATDSDIPANPLTYTLSSVPLVANASIDTNGIITWTPTPAQVPSVVTFTTIVTDTNQFAVTNNRLSDTNTFTVTVQAIHNGPILPLQTNRTVDEMVQMIVTNTAADNDLPARHVSYQLLPPSFGASIDTNGVITWTPNESQGPGVYTLTTVATDDDSSPISNTNSFQVTVNEVNRPPVLPHPQPNRTIAGLATLIVTNTATDPDIPANPLTYVLASSPPVNNAVIDTNGIITWTPTPAQVPSVVTFTTIVTDTNQFALFNNQLSDTNTFTVAVQAVHNGPSLPVQTNQTVNEMTELIVTNTATDTDVPARHVSYQLLPPSFGATIDTNGIITWTPDETQGPGVYTLTTVATDDDPSPISNTNSFQVTVNEVNRPPVLPHPQADRVITALTTLIVTNTATDPDIPPNPLTYALFAAPPVTNAVIDTNGIITWTPTAQQAPSVVTFTTIVTDTNQFALFNNQLSDTNSFTVTVQAATTPPTILSISVANGSALITWTSVAKQTYRLQYKDDVLATNWQSVVPDITATGSTTTATNATGGASQQYYRVLMLP